MSAGLVAVDDRSAELQQIAGIAQDVGLDARTILPIGIDDVIAQLALLARDGQLPKILVLDFEWERPEIGLSEPNAAAILLARLVPAWWQQLDAVIIYTANSAAVCDQVVTVYNSSLQLDQRSKISIVEDKNPSRLQEALKSIRDRMLQTRSH